MKFSISIFLHFRTQQVFPRYLAKFQPIMSIITRGFWTFISENLRSPLISLFQVLVENLRKWCHFLKNTALVEIIMTINVKNCTNIWAKVFVILYANCCTDCYHNFNLCGIFEEMTSFSPILNQDFERGKLMATVNSWK